MLWTTVSRIYIKGMFLYYARQEKCLRCLWETATRWLICWRASLNARDSLLEFLVCQGYPRVTFLSIILQLISSTSLLAMLPALIRPQSCTCDDNVLWCWFSKAPKEFHGFYLFYTSVVLPFRTCRPVWTTLRLSSRLLRCWLRRSCESAWPLTSSKSRWQRTQRWHLAWGAYLYSMCTWCVMANVVRSCLRCAPPHKKDNFGYIGEHTKCLDIALNMLLLSCLHIELTCEV